MTACLAKGLALFDSTEYRIEAGAGSVDDLGPVSERLARMAPWTELGITAPALRNVLSDPAENHIVLRLYAHNELSGIASLRRPWWRGDYLELFAILPAFQNRGLGRHFLSQIESRIPGPRGNLWLMVSQHNTHAQHFYSACGFCKIGLIEDYFAPGRHELLYRKIIVHPSLSPAEHQGAASKPAIPRSYPVDADIL